MPQFMGSQRVRHDRVTELNLTDGVLYSPVPLDCFQVFTLFNLKNFIYKLFFLPEIHINTLTPLFLLSSVLKYTVLHMYIYAYIMLYIQT